MKIAFFDTKLYDIETFNKYNGINNINIKFFETKLCEDTVDLANGFDCVCVFVNDTVNKYVIDKLCEFNVKAIALRCAGFNNVDVVYAYNKIHVLRVPVYSPYSVAEHAMALLLTSVRRIHKAYIRTKDFNFSLNDLTGFDLYNKTVGIIGTGKIGKVFADICLGFKMKVLAFDKYRNPELLSNDNVKYVELDELFEKSDIISLHCPLNESTYHIIDNSFIEKCKKGVILINTSRGGLVDTESLIAGIKQRKIGAACLDVYEEESEVFFEDFSNHIIDDDNLARLISLPNVIVTSHQAFLTKEALENICDITIANIKELFDNGRCSNEICYKNNVIEDCKDGKCF